MPIPSPEPIDHLGGLTGKSLIREQIALRTLDLEDSLDVNFPKLNRDQRAAFDAIVFMFALCKHI